MHWLDAEMWYLDPLQLPRALKVLAKLERLGQSKSEPLELVSPP